MRENLRNFGRSKVLYETDAFGGQDRAIAARGNDDAWAVGLMPLACLVPGQPIGSQAEVSRASVSGWFFATTWRGRKVTASQISREEATDDYPVETVWPSLVPDGLNQRFSRRSGIPGIVFLRSRCRPVLVQSAPTQRWPLDGLVCAARPCESRRPSSSHRPGLRCFLLPFVRSGFATRREYRRIITNNSGSDAFARLAFVTTKDWCTLRRASRQVRAGQITLDHGNS
jgi:hypothetical protein